MLPSDGVQVKFRFTADVNGAKVAGERVKALEAEVAALKQQLGGTETQTKKTVGGLEKIGSAAGQLRQVGAVMTAAGAAISGAMLMTARAYVAQVGTGEQASRRWLGASKDIETAQMRIGRSVTQAVVPALERAADLAEKIAEYSEKNPGAVKAVAGGAAALTIGGGLLMGAGAAADTIQKLGKLLGTGGALAGLGKLLAGLGKGALGVAGSTAGAVTGGLLAGVVGNDALARTQWGQQIGMQPANRFLTVGAYGLGKLFGGEEKGLAWAKSIGTASGALDKVAASGGKAGRELDFTSQQIGVYASYLRQEQNAERQHRIQLALMERDFNRDQMIAEQDYLRQRTISMRDFARQEKYAETDYYRQRLIRARDFGIQVARQEEDHQRQLRRSREDHEWRLRQIMLNGDALAFWEENRQYELDRKRGEEDYQINQQRQNEDFSRELADQEREFTIQRQRRAADFAIQMKDAAEQFAIQRKRAKEEYSLRLQDNERQYAEERRQRQQAFYDQLRDLYGDLEKERILRQQFNAAMLSDLQAAINAAKGGKGIWTQVAGSTAAVAGSGAATTGTNGITAAPWEASGAVERITGSRQAQDSALARLSGSSSGARGGRQIVYQDQRVFNRGLSVEDRDDIRSMIDQQLAAAFAA